jgi:hypothetical protein
MGSRCFAWRRSWATKGSVPYLFSLLVILRALCTIYFVLFQIRLYFLSFPLPAVLTAFILCLVLILFLLLLPLLVFLFDFLNLASYRFLFFSRSFLRRVDNWSTKPTVFQVSWAYVEEILVKSVKGRSVGTVVLLEESHWADPSLCYQVLSTHYWMACSRHNRLLQQCQQPDGDAKYWEET